MLDLNYKAILFTIAFCTIYIAFQTQIAINHDTIWLVEAAHRLVNGGDYVERAYETNLPSSIIMHFPVAWLMKAGFDFFTSVYIYAFIVIFFLLACTYNYLKKHFADISNLLLAFVFFATLTLYLQGFYFFERDVIIFLLITPFLLVEYKNFQTSLPKSDFRIPLVLMSLGCLIKPHYAIIPLIIYATKLIKKSSFTIYHFAIPSFMILATIVAFYLYVPEFFTVIWPDIKNIYLGLNIGKNEPKIRIFIIFYLLFFIPLIPLFFKKKSEKNQLARFFLYASMLFFLTFLLQNKGFNYHILPSMICIITSFCLHLHALLQRKWIVFFLLGLLIISKMQMAYTTRSYEKLTNLPINSIMTETFGSGSFLIFHNSLQYQQYLHAYSDFTSVSRFPALWCYSLYYPENINNETYEEFRQKCFKLAFGDVINQQPDIIIIPFIEYYEEENGFYAYALKQDGFKTYLNNNYQLHTTKTIDSMIYNRSEKSYEVSPMILDIYKKL